MPAFPVVPESHTHVLAEFDCLEQLLSALRLDSGRLKCTCLAVSRKWLALGTSAGGLHLIQREGWKQRLILSHKEGSITQVCCCPHDEDFIAVATSQGLVVVWELQQERRGRPERVSLSWEHRGQSVTSLVWDSSSLRVFIGDTVGKVSFLRAGSSKMGKGSAFVMFPVQTITTVDSRVVQLGYHDGRLLVSSLSRCYLCDTDKEKFWRVGNKERDGEYGACFFPQSRGGGGAGGPLGLGGQQPPPLLYCARPGSRVWEASFSGEVLSTHQFKQLLACPPLPLITYRSEPRYNPAQKSSQSIAFPKLLYMGEQHLLTWTHSALYILTPHSGQVLLWSEISDVVEVAVYRSELFCLHGDGRLSHLSLVSVERCVERLLRRESWSLAATVCCMFPHCLTAGRARKSVPIDRLDFLRSQLSAAAHPELIGQLEEVIARLEPLDSASSSRRSSISSHESFNVLDCGIYRVISRRGSQSDEESGSLINQSVSEEERLKDFGFGQEDEQLDPEVSERPDSAQFHLPLSFRSKPPRIALQAVRDSVSSFVKKTTERMNSLQMNAELWQRPPDPREGVEGLNISTLSSEDDLNQVYTEMTSADSDLQELRTATERAISQIQDPLVLLDPAHLAETLLEWLPVLEQVLGPEELEETWPRGRPLTFSEPPQNVSEHPQTFSEHPEALPEPPQNLSEPPQTSDPPEALPERPQNFSEHPEALPEPSQTSEHPEIFAQLPQTSEDPQTFSEHPEASSEPQQTFSEPPRTSERPEASPEHPQTCSEQPTQPCDPEEPAEEEDGVVDPEQRGVNLDQSEGGQEEEVVCVRVVSPRPLTSDLLEELTQLATLYLELRCFGQQVFQKEGVRAVGASSFLRRYFYLLDQERVRRMCVQCFQDQPQLHASFMEAMLELTGSSKAVEVFHKGDLLKSLRCLREMQPWSAAHLLAHLQRLYDRHGEAALRSFSQFYPTITPSDITAMAQGHHFLAYLDNLVQSQAEEQRLWFLGSLLQPESLRQEWLQLALTHDAPQLCDTQTADGQPRWHSHYFSWGYGRLLSLLTRLPADLTSKQKMAETCRSHGYWTGYLHLCCELGWRPEAFSTVCQLDDISLLEEPNGLEPQTLEEWKLLVQLSQQSSNVSQQMASNGSGAAALPNGSAEAVREVTPEALTLRLARMLGPQRALGVLQECGLDLVLSEHSTLVCHLLAVAEKRQRSLIHTMLERCDRFLWSQHA